MGGTMPVVRGTLRDAANTPVDGIVTLRLITSTDGTRPPAFLAGGVTVIAEVQPAVAGDGTWTQDVVSNLDPALSPVGTYYEVIAQAQGEPAKGFAIVVPNGAGPYDVTSIVVDPPSGMVSSGLATHIAANPAHAADHISFAPTVDNPATDVQHAIVVAGAGTGYLHTQLNASYVWTANHNRNSYPGGIYVEESTGDELLGYVRQDPSPDQLILTFPYQVSGFIRLK